MASIVEKIRTVRKKPTYLKYNKNSRFGQQSLGTQTNPYGNGRSFLSSVNQAKMNTTYGMMINRIERYLDYEMMDTHPLISNALDIMCDDIVSQNAGNDILDIKSDNEEIVAELETLFHDVLDIEFNLWFWARNMLKYGDQYNLLQSETGVGIVNTMSLPANFVERKEELTTEGFDVQFIFTNNQQPIAEDQMLNFRIIGDEKLFPYGKSILEPARRTWKLLRMMEDSMMIYRVSRGPERRVFYVEVGNLNADQVESYINEVRNSTMAMPVINPETGEVDIRYGPTAITEDFYIPTRGGMEMNKVDVLKGGDNTNQIEDVNFILNELLSALKIPKAFLGYETTITRNNLSAEDIRYARTIQRFQKMIINELYKAAYIHLTLLGYSDEDLVDFELNLYNPSQTYEMQKLEVLKARNEVAESLSGLFSEEYIYKEIYDLSEQEIKMERIRKINELKYRAVTELLSNVKASQDIAQAVKELTAFTFDYDAFFTPSNVADTKEKKPESRQSKVFKKDPEKYSPEFGALKQMTSDMAKTIHLNDSEFTNNALFITKIKKNVLERIAREEEEKMKLNRLQETEDEEKQDEEKQE